MVFTIKGLPRLGHVVMLVNNSDRADTMVLDYFHTFTQDDIDEGRILYVSASQQVCQSSQLLSSPSPHTCLSTKEQHTISTTIGYDTIESFSGTILRG